jgi:hypothetical protein
LVSTAERTFGRVSSRSGVFEGVLFVPRPVAPITLHRNVPRLQVPAPQPKRTLTKEVSQTKQFLVRLSGIFFKKLNASSAVGKLFSKKMKPMDKTDSLDPHRSDLEPQTQDHRRRISADIDGKSPRDRSILSSVSRTGEE